MDILIYLMVFGPMAAAILSYLIGRKSKVGRDSFVRIAVAGEFILSLCLLVLFGNVAGEELVKIPAVCGLGLNFTAGGFRCIYAAIAAFMWLITGLLSPEYFAHYRNRNRYYLFQLVRWELQSPFSCPAICIPPLFSSRSCLYAPMYGWPRMKRGALWVQALLTWQWRSLAAWCC